MLSNAYGCSTSDSNKALLPSKTCESHPGPHHHPRSPRFYQEPKKKRVKVSKKQTTGPLNKLHKDDTMRHVGIPVKFYNIPVTSE